MPDHGSEIALERLQRALIEERTYLTTYEQPGEPVVYETLRCLDDVFCRDLVYPNRASGKGEREHRAISTWGVNQALKRIVPRKLVQSPFRDFASDDLKRAQADDFVFHCGALEFGERLEHWLREGIVSGQYRLHHRHSGRDMEVVVLRSNIPSYFDEEIGRAGLRWASNSIVSEDSPWEQQLEEQFRAIEPQLQRNVHVLDSWRLLYASTPEIDKHFEDWAKLYLRRMFSQDMIGPEDVVGGRPFSQYAELLHKLSAWSQRHIAFAVASLREEPDVHLRNLLTTYRPRNSFVTSLAAELGGERQEIERILDCFVLSPANLDRHTATSEIAWAPVVQASERMFLLPAYGIDVNPFLFLLTELRNRYQGDWFKVANERESRWSGELDALFDKRTWQTRARNVRLTDSGKQITDIDFAVWSAPTNELGIFQLKWQHPVGLDNRGRRSTAGNLINSINGWIESVLAWIDKYGSAELARRLNFKARGSPQVTLFALGRYHVHFTGFDERDQRAIWTDWAHFSRALTEGSPITSPSELAKRVESLVGKSRGSKQCESLIVPVGQLAVVVNPTQVPD